MTSIFIWFCSVPKYPLNYLKKKTLYGIASFCFQILPSFMVSHKGALGAEFRVCDSGRTREKPAGGSEAVLRSHFPPGVEEVYSLREAGKEENFWYKISLSLKGFQASLIMFPHL